MFSLEESIKSHWYFNAMFAYLGNTINIPAPATLVATPLPNSIALRAPYDNVSPSVSSSQLDNNARGNRNYLPKENVQQTIVANTSVESFSAGSSQTNLPSYSANAQTSFLTQLAAGDISAEVRGLFAQYDKLVSYANVKYKPSNAGKPTEPISMFKTLLQLEQDYNSHNLPDELPIDLPSDLPYTQNAILTQVKEIAAPDDITLAQEEIIAVKQEEAPDGLNQVSLKLYNSTALRNDYNAPTDVEIA